MNFDDLNIEDFVIPLHNKNWVLNELSNIANDDLDGSIVLGIPVYSDNVEMKIFMLGLKTQNGEVDDQSFIGHITRKYWNVLSDLNLLELDVMESTSAIGDYDYADLEGLKSDKQLNSFISEIIAQSLFTENSIDIKSTADCKKAIKDIYGIDKVKRVSKHKWNNIDYRMFNDENGNIYSLVSYKEKLISHYQIEYNIVE